MADKIIHAFNPIINLFQGLAYPLCYIAIATGVCMLIIGQKHAALKMIKYAIIGFLAMNWLPGLMKILMEVGNSMK